MKREDDEVKRVAEKKAAYLLYYTILARSLQDGKWCEKWHFLISRNKIIIILSP